MFGFSQKEKREHYNGIVKGTVPVKKDSKFSPAEQIAYARGQADARNESARICAYKKATPIQRKAYKEEKAKKRAEFKAKSSRSSGGVFVDYSDELPYNDYY